MWLVQWTWPSIQEYFKLFVLSLMISHCLYDIGRCKIRHYDEDVHEDGFSQLAMDLGRPRGFGYDP